MSFDDYEVVLYRNQPDGCVADIPSIPGCHALMPTATEALTELAGVFRMIEEEYRETNATRHDRNRPCLAVRAGEFLRVATKLGFRRARREIGPPLFYRILQQLGIDENTFDQLR